MNSLVESKSEKRNPYVGPRPFVRSEGTHFFGREKEARRIVDLIYANSVLVIYSQSGAGKTSLLRARIVPQFEDEGFDVFPPVRVAGQVDQHDISEVRNVYVLNALCSLTNDHVDFQRLTEYTLAGYLEKQERVIDEFGRPSARLLLFDQFEEMFVHYPDHWEDRQDFFKQVRDALDHDPILRIVFSVRDEYLGAMEPYASLLRGKLQANFYLERLGREGALEAVKYPLQSIGKDFAEGVAERIVDDLMKTRYTTPEGNHIEKPGQYIEPVQLQVVLQHLWRSLPTEVEIITDDYIPNVTADVDRALSDFYDEAIRIVAQDAGVDEVKIRRWFEQTLITEAHTRALIARGPEETGGMPNLVADALENRHLIRAESRAGMKWYELTHDRLVRPILESNKHYF